MLTELRNLAEGTELILEGLPETVELLAFIFLPSLLTSVIIWLQNGLTLTIILTYPCSPGSALPVEIEMVPASEGGSSTFPTNPPPPRGFHYS